MSYLVIYAHKYVLCILDTYIHTNGLIGRPRVFLCLVVHPPPIVYVSYSLLKIRAFFPCLTFSFLLFYYSFVRSVFLVYLKLFS